MDMEYITSSSGNITATTEADFSSSSGESNVTEYNTTEMDANESAGEDEEMLRIAFFIGHFVHQYYIPVLCCTGSIGNILSVFVFFRTKLKVILQLLPGRSRSERHLLPGRTLRTVAELPQCGYL